MLLGVFPNKRVPSLKEGPPPPTYPVRQLTEALAEYHPGDAMFCQYLLVGPQGVLPQVYRLSGESLSLMGQGLGAFMFYLGLDMDLKTGDKKRQWSEGEFDLWVLAARKAFPLLRSAYLFATRHGARGILPFSRPIEVDPPKWSALYLSTLDSLRGSEAIVGGEWDTRCKDFSRLLGLPNISRDDGHVQRAVVVPPDEPPVDPGSLPYNPVYAADKTFNELSPQGNDELVNRLAAWGEAHGDETESALREASVQAASREAALNSLAKQALDAHAAVQFAVKYPKKVAYELWRAIAVNLAVLYEKDPEGGKRKFLDISELDPERFSLSGAEAAWEDARKSASRYGPITFRECLTPEMVSLHPPLGQLDPSGSIAGDCVRAARHIWKTTHQAPAQAPMGHGGQTPPPNAPAFTIEQVKAMLETTTTVRGRGANQTIETVPKLSLTNLYLIMTHDPSLRGMIFKNVLGYHDEWIPNGRVDDDALTSLMLGIEKMYGLSYKHEVVHRMVSKVGAENLRHPVREYLESLSWDGVDRVPDLVAAMRAVPNATSPVSHEEILRKWLIAAVARPMGFGGPPVKVDNVLVLQGFQGYKKSGFFETLCVSPEWFSDSLPSLDRKEADAGMQLIGHWFVEVAELERFMGRGKNELLKAFITRKEEKFRLPFERRARHRVRNGIIVGTANSPHFLSDPTGERRYWVIPIAGTIDLAWVEANRDQLWAQAVHAHRQGIPWWFDTTEPDSSEFSVPDPIRERVSAWAVTVTGSGRHYQMSEILESVLFIPAGKHVHYSVFGSIKEGMMEAGFVHARRDDGNGRRISAFWPPAPPHKGP